MSSARDWSRRAGLAAAGALLVGAPMVAADETAPGSAVPELRALASAAAWSDVLDSYRVPELPPPGESESLILILDGPAAGRAAPPNRAKRAGAITESQQEIEQAIAGIGGVVTYRYRQLINGLAVRVPTGRISALAQLPSVKAIVPVTYLAPAAEPSQEAPSAPTGSARAPAASGPAHVALIDGGIDVSHPWLGGGMGATYPIIGGADFVERDDDPSLPSATAEIEPHGTQMASVILRSSAITELLPEQRPRLLSYRVIAAEQVDGRLRPLARTDRVVAALERAVDPDGDGDPGDAPAVIAMGLSRGFDGGGLDPVAVAINAVDRLGSLVVVPAGNDGPTFSRSGTVGGPATARAALVVGGLAAGQAPRTARLGITIGEARASTDPLPVLGSSLPAQPLEMQFVGDAGVISRGDVPDDYVDDNGSSRVAGKLAIVVRGGGSLQEKARAAHAAGAVALGVWDQQGPGLFPGVDGGADWPIPVLGMGPRQGTALQDLLAGGERVRVNLSERAPSGEQISVAGFSSRGPTGDGRAAPHLVAPATGVPAAFPGEDQPREAPLTGTSAAAAEITARALRLRIDRPELAPADVRSILIASAQPIESAGVRDRGAGVLGSELDAEVTIAPSIVTVNPGPAGVLEADVRVRTLGEPARYQLALENGDAAPQLLGPPRKVGPGFSVASIDIPGTALPGTDLGYLTVRDAEGRVKGRAPVIAEAPVKPGRNVLPAPKIQVRGSVGQVTVTLGQQAIDQNRLKAVRLHQVRMWLIPAGGGAPTALSGYKEAGDWPAGTYRFLLSQRVADGTPLPDGAFRIRVTARGPAGHSYRADSRVFSIAAGKVSLR